MWKIVLPERPIQKTKSGGVHCVQNSTRECQAKQISPNSQGNPQPPNPHRFIKAQLNTHSVYRSDPRHLIKVLMTMHLVHRNARSVSQASEEALAPIGEQDSTGHDIGPRTSKPSSLSKEPDSRVLRGYCGAEGFGKAQPISYQAQGLC